MPIQLSPVEVRVLGCLIEKSVTTPEYYPMTVNALTNACNQKSSRDPVMELDSTAVVRAIFTLKEKGLVVERSEEGSRALKYAHWLKNLIQGTPEEIAVLCVLMLRGPQTPGELKGRTDRFVQFKNPADVEAVLQNLSQRADGPFVKKMERQPGHKESRYVHLLSGEAAAETVIEAIPPTVVSSPLEERVAALEKEVADLKAALLELRETKESPQ